MLDYLVDMRIWLIFLCIIVFGIWFSSRKQGHGFPPGPTPLPFIGKLLILAWNPGRIHVTLMELSHKYGPVVGFRLGSCPAVILNSLEAIREAFVKNADCSSCRPHCMTLVNRFHSRPEGAGIKGVLWTNGERWNQSKRILASSLRDTGVNKGRLEEIIQNEANEMYNELVLLLGNPQDVRLILQQCVCNIVCKLCFGCRFEYKETEFLNAMEMLSQIFASPVFSSAENVIPELQNIPGPRWHKKLFKTIDKLSQWILSNIKKEQGNFGMIRKYDGDPFIEDNMTHDGDPFIEDNMTHIVLDVFLAGIETTTTALHWLLLRMIHHKDVQRKCQEEIDHVIGAVRHPDGNISNMPYVKAVLHETLRLHSVSVGAIHGTQNDTTIHGYNIPKGTIVFGNLYSVHMDRQYWDEPEMFKPERWISEDGSFQNMEGFLAFSCGPRGCPGEAVAWKELFLLFTFLLQKFNFNMVDPKKPPTLEGKLGITLSPKDYQIIVHLR